MPDLTSTLLAMYQQLIGGSAAREQSSLESECARRVITSGLSISAVGTFAFPGNLTVGGTLSVNIFNISGSFTVTGNFTTGTLNVTGAASVGGVFSCATNATVGGLLTASGGVVTTNVSGTGILSMSGFGFHNIVAGGAGTQDLVIQNTLAGAGNATRFLMGNDALQTLAIVQVLSSTFALSGPNVPSGCNFTVQGSGGLSLTANHASGALRFYTGGNIERMRITPAGEVAINAVAAIASGKFSIAADLTLNQGISVQNLSAGNSGNLVLFVNSTGASCGNIAQSGATTIIYGASSDARLKDDLGLATDLTALRALRIRDFRWKDDGTLDRGVFAQEAYGVFPRAIWKGNDSLTANGRLREPWMTDYSKFVADLIVGWQSHDRRLHALEARLDIHEDAA